MKNAKHKPTKASLSVARQRLIELMQQINFGRIEQLEVINGDPILTSSLRVYRDIVFGKSNTPHRTRSCDDFILKEQVYALLDLFDHVRLMKVEKLVIQNGLPVRMTVVEGHGML